MGAALEAGYDLGALTALYVAIACLALIAFIVGGIASLLDFSIFGVRPLHAIAVELESVIVAGCNTAIKALERTATSFQSGLIDSLAIFIGLAALLYLGTRAALEYLWSHALRPLIVSYIEPWRSVASEAKALAIAASDKIASEAARLERRIATDVSGAVATAEQFAASQVAEAEHAFNRGLNDLVDRFDEEIARLRQGIEGDVSGSLDTLRRAEEAAAASAAAAIGATAGELRDLERQLPLADIAAGIAAIPLLRAAVQVLEAETGLENESCRRKVKDICGVSPARWERLIAGLVLTAEWPGIEAFAEHVAELAPEIVDAVEALVAA